jgi:hypothetical protein
MVKQRSSIMILIVDMILIANANDGLHNATGLKTITYATTPLRYPSALQPQPRSICRSASMCSYLDEEPAHFLDHGLQLTEAAVNLFMHILMTASNPVRSTCRRASLSSKGIEAALFEARNVGHGAALLKWSW